MTPPLESHLGRLTSAVSELLRIQPRHPRKQPTTMISATKPVVPEIKDLGTLKATICDDRIPEHERFGLIKKLGELSERTDVVDFLDGECLRCFQNSEHLLCAVAQVLGEFDCERAAESLMRMLRLPHTATLTPTVTWNAAESLGKLTVDISREAALAVFDDQDARKVKVSLARVLARFRDDPYFNKVHQLFDDCLDDISDTGHLCECLARINEERAAPLVLSALQRHIIGDTEWWGIDGIVDACRTCLAWVSITHANCLISHLTEVYPRIHTGNRRSLSPFLADLAIAHSSNRELIEFIRQAAAKERALAAFEKKNVDSVTRHVISEASREVTIQLNEALTRIAKMSLWSKEK